MHGRLHQALVQTIRPVNFKSVVQAPDTRLAGVVGHLQFGQVLVRVVLAVGFPFGIFDGGRYFEGCEEVFWLGAGAC